MSAKKRRAVRLIDRVVRMDATRSRMPRFGPDGLTGIEKALTFWEACMTPLGKKMTRKGLRVRAMHAMSAARADRIATGGRP